MDSVKGRHAPYPEGMTQTEWITRTQAAIRLGVSLRTIRRYMVAERIRYERDPVTGRVWIDADSLSTPVPVPDRYL